MRAKLLGQPLSKDEQIGETLDRLLPVAMEFHVVTAWAQITGLAQIADSVGELRSRGGTATIVLGIDGGIATKESLELALELFDPALVFHDTGNRLFHPKMYRIELSDKTVLLTGSSNLTGRGLYANYEANVQLDLDHSDPEDVAVIDEAKTYREWLVSDGMPIEKLSSALIAKLAEDDGLLAAKAEREELERAAQARTESLARKIFGAAVTGLPHIPRAKAAAARSSNGAHAPTGSAPPSDASVSLRWTKSLKPSDVLRKPEGSNERNYVVLGAAGHAIDRNTWFREILFGSANWQNRTMRTGNTKEEAEIPFDVWIDDRFLGTYELRVDHALNRIADQNNAPTYLNWASMKPVIQQNDFRGWWLELAGLADGTFRLRLLSTEPTET